MPVDATRVSELVAGELRGFRDPAVLPRVQSLFIKPRPVERQWDYGAPDEWFACWVVLEHWESNTGIAYCDQGFGPENPWGLIYLEGPHMGTGMDSAWFPRLEIAIKESMAWDDDAALGGRTEPDSSRGT